jgi:hypothetical protein
MSNGKIRKIEKIDKILSRTHGGLAMQQVEEENEPGIA